MERSTIHLLHKRGRSQRQIAAELGHSRTTVARVLTEPVDRRPARRQRRSIVDPYREQITRWLGEGLSAVRMLERARTDPGAPYTGGHSVFRAAVRRARLAQAQAQAVRDVPVRFEGLPGEYLQVDWGEVRAFPFTQQAPATRYFLACRLKYSRWTWVRFTAEMRQEALFRGLVDCWVALGWVPWVLVFDNMKTVTTGRDADDRPIWHPALLQLAAECGFHPEACTPGAGNQKGSVEALVKWVKGNFLAGREFADDADLTGQCTEWLEYANTRPSQATDEPPVARLVAEAARGGALPPTAADYGFLQPGRVNTEALVAVLGNQYSVPIAHVGAPVTVRVHRGQIALWRDTVLLAEHPRAPDGAHRRVVEPAHYALLFAHKPRAQVMLYRQALVDLGGPARWYLSELSHRQRARLREEVLGVYALYHQYGAAALLAAMAYATERGAYGADYLRALRGARPDQLVRLDAHAVLAALPAAVPAAAAPVAAALIAPPAPSAPSEPSPPAVPAAPDAGPGQAAIDRPLSAYEAYVWRDGRDHAVVAAAPTAGTAVDAPPEPVAAAAAEGA